MLCPGQRHLAGHSNSQVDILKCLAHHKHNSDGQTPSNSLGPGPASMPGILFEFVGNRQPTTHFNHLLDKQFTGCRHLTVILSQREEAGEGLERVQRDSSEPDVTA